MEHGTNVKTRVKRTRRSKEALGEQRVIQEKHLEERKEKFVSVKPMNDLQAEYIRVCKDPEVAVVLATGYAGTSKTYIPTCIAAEQIHLGQINKIYLVRPAISSSKSLGFFGGSLIEKSKNWLAPILDTLYEKLGKNVVDLYIERGDIEPIPLETIKGRSLKNCFIIVDESEDLVDKEFIKVVTRLGNNATMVFAGDILQSDLTGSNGMSLAISMIQDGYEVPWAWVDFNQPSDIVRSDATRKAIMAFHKKGLM